MARDMFPAWLREIPRATPLRAGLVAVAWLFTAGASSCSSGGTASAVTFSTDLLIRNAAGVIEDRFAVGAPINFELRVRNRTDTPAVVQFATGHQFDFIVVDDGTANVRWKWSDGKAFVTVATELEFAAGETKVFTTTWDQAGRGGQAVGPGNYEARGALVFSQLVNDPLFQGQLGSPLKPFSIF
jgi:hypothetical protein